MFGNFLWESASSSYTHLKSPLWLPGDKLPMWQSDAWSEALHHVPGDTNL